MATFHDRTTAPTEHPRLLRGGGATPCAVLTSAEVIALTADKPPRPRDARGRFVSCAIEAGVVLAEDTHSLARFGECNSAPNDFSALRCHHDTPRAVASDALQVGAGLPKSGEPPRFHDHLAKPELPPEPLLSADVPHAAAGDARHGGAGHGDIATPLAFHGGVPFIPPKVPTVGNLPADLDPVHAGLDAARAIHLRRQLAQAVEHGAALFAALGLPRLVEPGSSRNDIGMAGDALDLAIATLDALDGDADREDGGDYEHSLGAPERHPCSPPVGDFYYRPGNGSFCRNRGDKSQALWAQGSRQGGEGESEPGYDLPCDDDERCASEHDGREPEDCREPYLSVVEWDGLGDNWSRSGATTIGIECDLEEVNEDGAGQYDPNWTERQHGPFYDHTTDVRL